MMTMMQSMATPAVLNFLPGPSELIIILFIVLLIFGPKKLPEMGKAIGQSIRELKRTADTTEGEAEEAGPNK